MVFDSLHYLRTNLLIAFAWIHQLLTPLSAVCVHILLDIRRHIPCDFTVGTGRRYGEILRLVPALIRCGGAVAGHGNAAAALIGTDVGNAVPRIEHERKGIHSVPLGDELGEDVAYIADLDEAADVDRIVVDGLSLFGGGGGAGITISPVALSALSTLGTRSGTLFVVKTVYTFAFSLL